MYLYSKVSSIAQNLKKLYLSNASQTRELCGGNEGYTLIQFLWLLLHITKGRP